MLAAAPPSPDLFASPAALLHDLLAVSLTAVNLLRPLYGPDGTELVDFAVEYLNPAAQRMTALPERPNVTAQARFPDLFANGVFAFYRRVFETGEAGRYDFNYQADGFDNYFHVAARRSGALLVVSFTDTADQDRTPVELALRASQAAERAARAEAEAQRQRLADLIMQAPAPIISLVGPGHTIVLANHHFRQLFGQRALEGYFVRAALPELAGQPYFDFLDEVYRTGETFYGNEMPVQLDRTHSGRLELGYFNFINQATRDATGAVTGVLVQATDVTEQVRARQQIETMNRELETRVAERTAEALAAVQRQAQARADFFQVFEETPASIALLRGPELRFDYLNPAYQRLFPGRALLGCPVAEALPEAAAQGFVAWLEAVYRTGETFFGHEAHLVVEQADGQPPRDAYYTFTYQAYREAGEIVGISIFAYDVAEQVQARQAQRRHLEDLFEQAPVAFAVFRGPRHTVELANAAACALWGRTPAQVVHRSILDVLPELADQGIQELLDGVVTTGVPYVNPELRVELDRHGRRDPVYFNLIYQPLREPDGRIDGMTVIAVDVSEQVRARQHLAEANDALTAANAQLTRTNTDLDTFIYTASHDLKQPIANIEGLLDTLREQLPAEALQVQLVPPVLNMMQGAVERFQLTIAQLTDVSKLQQADAQPAETVALAPLLEDIRLDLPPALLAGVRLTVDVAACPAVSFAPRHLRSILYNLLSNALKYRHPDRVPEVRVRAHPGAGGTAVLDVQDNGLGLSKDQQAKLFGLFQRLHTHVEGSGVGLYMVKRIIDNAGGTIAVQSQPGAGTTFTVTLPNGFILAP